MTKEFYCCAKKCTKFEAEAFVQLGYNGTATPLVFMPQLGATGIAIPERGSVVDENTLRNLQPLKVAAGNDSGGQQDLSIPRGFIFH